MGLKAAIRLCIYSVDSIKEGHRSRQGEDRQNMNGILVLEKGN